MVDPEDNVKAVLAEVCENHHRRRTRRTTIAMLACGLGTLGAMLLTLLTMPGPMAILGVLATACCALLTGVFIATGEQRRDRYVTARSTRKQWEDEIRIQNREVERDHEDGEPA